MIRPRERGREGGRAGGRERGGRGGRKKERERERDGDNSIRGYGGKLYVSNLYIILGCSLCHYFLGLALVKERGVEILHHLTRINHRIVLQVDASSLQGSLQRRDKRGRRKNSIIK